jgi:hypothetical protein
MPAIPLAGAAGGIHSSLAGAADGILQGKS